MISVASEFVSFIIQEGIISASPVHLPDSGIGAVDSAGLSRTGDTVGGHESIRAEACVAQEMVRDDFYGI